MGIHHVKSLDLHAKWPCGEKDLITDVPGVLVGHTTLTDPAKDIHTGVTAVLPHGGNLFRDKVMAACAVINGFGKSIGLLQVQELGTIETPIILTNTMSIGTAYTALCKYMLEQNPDIGVTTGTVNCLVTECNDSSLNDIRGMHVQESDVRNAIETAAQDFAEGCVGGGNGMRDIAIAFTTANRIPHDSDHDILTCRMFYDESIDKVFEASVEAVEEAIISSLYHAETTHGIRGKTAVSLRDFLNH